MLRAVADTRTVIWYLYNGPRLSESARIAVGDAGGARNQIGVCAITLLAPHDLLSVP